MRVRKNCDSEKYGEYRAREAVTCNKIDIVAACVLSSWQEDGSHGEGTAGEEDCG